MLYDPMVEPNSSTLLLQPSPSESGSQTTDEYSYRRYNKWNSNVPSDQSRANRPSKSAKSMSNASATLCSKSSTASSQVSNNSRTSNRTLEAGAAGHLNYLNGPNNTNLFQLNDHKQTSSNTSNAPFESFERDSPPPPAPGMFTPCAPYPNYSHYGQLSNSNSSHNNKQLLQQASNHRSNLISQRGHQTLNTRHQSKALHSNQAKQFEMREGPSVNLISNPLHCHRVAASGLQGSLPSLADCGLANNSINSSHVPTSSSRNGCVLLGEMQSSAGSGGRPSHTMQPVLNRNNHASTPTNGSSSMNGDNLYCEIEDAQRVQADFRRQLQQIGCGTESLDSEHSSIYYADSELSHQQAEQQRLAEQNDHLLSRPVRDFDDEDDEDEDVIDTVSKSKRNQNESESKTIAKTTNSTTATKERMPTFFGSVQAGRSNKILERRNASNSMPTDDYDAQKSNRFNFDVDRLIESSSTAYPHESNDSSSPNSNPLSPTNSQNRPNEPMASFYRFND